MSQPDGAGGRIPLKEEEYGSCGYGRQTVAEILCPDWDERNYQVDVIQPISGRNESMGEEKSDDPKIIVDDDWKSQVEAEKEKLRQELERQENHGNQSSGKPQMPPASFATLLSMLATQVMAALGQFPDPTDGKTHIEKPIAKHWIDTIAMLEEKTKGNLSQDEAKMLDELLHQMRILFVSVREKPTEEEKPKSKIELP